jgi:tripartite ATP-independent transporter DctM subunit
MDLFHSGLVMIGLLIALLVAGVPIAFALAAAGIFGLASDRPWRAIEYILATFSYSNTAIFSYIVLPLFLFMGHMAFSAGLSRTAFEAGQRWLGRFHGGLAAATIFACACFSTICGSSVATASTMAKVALPEMLRHGYKERLAAGCVASGGTLGVLIPPSGILVIYSIVTQVSLTQLFLAAFVPGVMTAVIYIIGIWLMVKINPDLAGPKITRRYTWREQVQALGGTWELFVLFALVMGSIYLGVATPTEAAALGALFAMIAVLRRPNRWKNISEGLRETGSATCSIFVLILGAGLFSLGLTTTQLPQALASAVTKLELSQTALIVIILLPYIVLGMFLDGISMILITVPLLYPIVQQSGFSGVLFGLLVTKAVEIGCLTPPVGLNAFVVKSTIPSLSLSEIFKGCIPFVIMEIIIVAIMIAFPQISLFLID